MSLVVSSITSNVYIMSIHLFYCVFIIIIIIIILICLTVYLSAAFIEWFYVYIAVMSVLTRDKFLNFIVETIKKYFISYLILSYLNTRRTGLRPGEDTLARFNKIAIQGKGPGGN